VEIRVKVFSAQHALKVAAFPWTASPQPLRGHLGLPLSLTDNVPSGVVTEYQVSKLQGKCPTTGTNTAAESQHLAGHLMPTSYVQAGWWLAGHSSLPGAGSHQK